jgi:hypothetical protein
MDKLRIATLKGLAQKMVLNDGQLSNSRGVRVHVSTRYTRGVFDRPLSARSGAGGARGGGEGPEGRRSAAQPVKAEQANSRTQVSLLSI